MSRSDQRFDYAAPAVLHENVPGGPIVTGVQTWRGGPIAEGTLAEMIRMGTVSYTHLTLPTTPYV